MQIIILIILIFFNAFFAAAEMAFVSLNDSKIESLASKGNKKAIKINKMLENPSKFLATIQIGITVAGFLSSAFAADNFVEVIAPKLYNVVPVIGISTWKTISLVLITLVLSFFTLIFGELVPKRLAMKYCEKVSFASINIITFISILTSPIVKFLTLVTNCISKLFGIGENEEESVTEEEIRMMVNAGQEKGTIKASEKEMINNVFEFNDRTVSEIMRNRTEVFAVEKNTTIAKLDEKLQEVGYRYSRVPVFDGTIDKIIGVVYLKDILKEHGNSNTQVGTLIRDALFVIETKMIDEVFNEMKTKKIQMAIVVDEYGGTAGIITMEDVLEEIVGNIYDEYDDIEFEYEKISENTYIFNGAIPIYEVNKIMKLEIPEGEYDTLSGFILCQLDFLSKYKDVPSIQTDYAIFKIEKYVNRKIELVKIIKK